jgi:hypothetical protein
VKLVDKKKKKKEGISESKNYECKTNRKVKNIRLV